MAKGWNIGENKLKINSLQQENAVLVGLVVKDQTEAQVQEQLDELEFLALTAGAMAKRRFIQKLPRPIASTFIGKGTLGAIRAYI